MSPQNPTIKLIRSLAEKKFRQETGLFVAEGWEMLDRARKAGWMPEHLVSTEAISDWGQARPILVTEKVMEGLSGQNNPHNVIATFGQRYVGEVTPNGVWVALEDMRDPGNLGTIIRTADAVAASGVILVGQSCDPYSGDCVRATTGSIFGVPLVRMETGAFIALVQNLARRGGWHPSQGCRRFQAVLQIPHPARHGQRAPGAFGRACGVMQNAGAHPHAWWRRIAQRGDGNGPNAL